MSGMIGKHTPGPWVIRRNQHKTISIAAKEKGGFLEVCSVPGAFVEVTEQEANARLIAAAPELLNCTRECLEMCKVWKDDTEKAIASAEDKQVMLAVIAIIEAKCLDAIAKAEGDGSE